MTGPGHGIPASLVKVVTPAFHASETMTTDALLPWVTVITGSTSGSESFRTSGKCSKPLLLPLSIKTADCFAVLFTGILRVDSLS